MNPVCAKNARTLGEWGFPARHVGWWVSRHNKAQGWGCFQISVKTFKTKEKVTIE